MLILDVCNSAPCNSLWPVSRHSGSTCLSLSLSLCLQFVFLFSPQLAKGDERPLQSVSVPDFFPLGRISWPLHCVCSESPCFLIYSKCSSLWFLILQIKVWFIEPPKKQLLFFSIKSREKIKIKKKSWHESSSVLLPWTSTFILKLGQHWTIAMKTNHNILA